MIKQSDIKGRLSLFRYGLVVITVVTFVISMLAPWAALSGLGDAQPPMTDFLGTAVLYTVIVAVIMVAIYFGYAQLLKRMMGNDGDDSA